MVVDDQREIIEFLSTPQAYGGSVANVERIDTHSSIIFLAGDRAYKLKRAVWYDYLDFSTPERRRTFCEAEVALNKRTAPSLYLDVMAVTRQPDGRLALGGSGTPLEWLVRMVRFDQEMLFDRLAARHALDVELMPGLAAAVARFHVGAERRDNHGGREGLAWVVDGNESGFTEQGSDIFDLHACQRVTALARAALARHAERLNTRRIQGFVRVCHGDLHLRNIVLLDGRPTLFDAVEFNDRISCVDMFYDLAFLLMDLWRLGLRAHANVLFNEYMAKTDQLDALGLMPLFLSCRSAVRAKTSATAARLQNDSVRATELKLAAREYLTMAERLLTPPGPRLIAIGGVSGSGKTTLAERLAPSIGPAPGACVLRSDVIRKSSFNLPPTTHLGPEGYTQTVTQHVYAALADRAAVVLQAGHAAIVDAVFGDPRQRQAVAEVARRAGVPFIGLWLEAPVNVLMDRLRSRQADASDATVDVLHQQLARNVEALDWNRIDSSGEPALVQKRAETLLAQPTSVMR